MDVTKIIETIPGKSEANRQQMRRNAERLLENGKKQQKQDAQAVIEALDAAEPTPATLAYDALSPEERQERVKRAFTGRPATETEAKVIQVLLDNPGTPSAQLSTACGWRGMTWHEKFGTMCKARQAYLWPAAWVPERKDYYYPGLFADVDDAERIFRVKPDVAIALDAVGFRPTHRSAR